MNQKTLQKKTLQKKILKKVKCQSRLRLDGWDDSITSFLCEKSGTHKIHKVCIDYTNSDCDHGIITWV